MFTREQYYEIEQLVKCALDSYNKNEAQIYINKLKSYSQYVQGNEFFLYTSLLNSVANASGRVSEKEKKEYFVRIDLAKVYSYCVAQEYSDK